MGGWGSFPVVSGDRDRSLLHSVLPVTPSPRSPVMSVEFRDPLSFTGHLLPGETLINTWTSSRPSVVGVRGTDPSGGPSGPPRIVVNPGQTTTPVFLGDAYVRRRSIMGLHLPLLLFRNECLFFPVFLHQPSKTPLLLGMRG